jgi:hypothetical protein
MGYSEVVTLKLLCESMEEADAGCSWRQPIALWFTTIPVLPDLCTWVVILARFYRRACALATAACVGW